MTVETVRWKLHGARRAETVTLEAARNVAGGSRDGGSRPKKRLEETVTVEAARRKLPETWRAKTVTLGVPRNMPGGHRDGGSCPKNGDREP